MVGEVDRIAIVDNASQNISDIERICKSIAICEVVEVGFNSGVAHALMIGVRYAVSRYNPMWPLFLDDDTIVMKGSVRAVLRSYERFLKEIREAVGAINLGSKEGKCRVYKTRLGIFSGTLIRADIATKTCCRSEFFMDQADFDLYSKIRRRGLLALQIRCKFVGYEPSWRYHYIVRNSTILLKEGALSIGIVKYLQQLFTWGPLILLKDGLEKFIKSFGLGLMYALLNRVGYLDKAYFNLRVKLYLQVNSFDVQKAK